MGMIFMGAGNGESKKIHSIAYAQVLGLNKRPSAVFLNKKQKRTLRKKLRQQEEGITHAKKEN